ncbi:hypothetical protein KAR91_82230 [Candidatus Pacearchaeota archaeon]|nr:hypothetical protein [Candidatus Pacearchaeota archaeon]
MTIEKLREENYGIPIGSQIVYNCHIFGRRFGDKKSVDTTNATKIYEFVNDSDKLRLRRGDIGRLDESYVAVNSKNRGEFIVVLDRYRIVKHKPHGTWKDYMIVVMLISGPNKGDLLKLQVNSAGNIKETL